MNMEIIQKNVDLKPYSWWKVGGVADYFCLPHNLDELKEAGQWAQDKKIPVTVLSGGTNSLISDKGIEGLVIHLKNLTGIQVKVNESEIFIQALAGTPKHQLFKVFSKHHLSPALFLCGLPGDVGGGVVMNAGVSGKVSPYEFSQLVCEVEVFSLDLLKVQTFLKEDLKWQYRSCQGWEKGVIYQVSFKWPLKPLEDFSQKLREVNRKRTSSQPLNQPSCGSVFKNPKNYHSGKLIEEAGLKGFSIGGAEISHKHANFIVNKGTATAQDIHQIICHVQKKIQDDFKVSLKTEIHYLGRWSG